jgi:hypothetical protein
MIMSRNWKAGRGNIKTDNGSFERAEQLICFGTTMCNGPTNALVCNKTLIQMSQIKTLKLLQHVSIIS